MEPEIYENINEDIFPGGLEQAIPIIWWLVHLLGGKVVFPRDEQFWLDNFPPDDSSRLILTVEEGQLVMKAEKLDWH